MSDAKNGAPVAGAGDDGSSGAQVPPALRLGKARAEIARVDREIIEALGRRAAAAIEIGELKRELNLSVYDAVQESRVYDRVEQALSEVGGPLTADLVRAIYREIIAAARALQESLAVAALGPEASMSHAAALAHFGSEVELVLEPTIASVFDAVSRGEAAVGIVPIENSIEGAVGATMDALMSAQLDVIGEHYMPVTYALLSKAESLDKVEVVYSHPQAIAQCAIWLSRHLPRARVEPVESTARAAQMAAADGTVAALAGHMAAVEYDVPVLADHTEDAPHNMTRFLVIGQGECEQTGSDKTSLIMSTAHASGALYAALSTFADHGISLNRLESRPLESRPWEYMFFIDFEGHREDGNVQACLAQLSERVSFHRVLGSYPQGARPW